MKLSIAGKSVPRPTPADIEGELGAASFSPDWRMALEEDGARLRATVAPRNSFIVTYSSGSSSRRGRGDAAAVKTAFVQYLSRDANWKAAIEWDKPENSSGKPSARRAPSLIGRDGNGPPPWAVGAMVIVIGLVLMLFTFPDLAYALFPATRSDWFWIALIFLPMAAIVLLALAAKLIELRRAASWETTTGRIVSSRIAQRSIKFENEAERIENYAAVTYEFTAPDGRNVRGSRIGIGDDNRGAEAAPTVERYPVGAEVAVYYDPADPTSCVLERGGPKGIEPKGCAMAVVGLIAATAIVWAWIARGPGIVRALFPRASENLVAMALGVGVLLCMMAYAQWRVSRAAGRWPTAAGTVVRSEVQGERDASAGVRRSLWRPVVEYTYAVAGHDYRCAQIGLNVTSSGTRGWAERVASRYPAGSAVTVRYDPANPGNAALENSGVVSWSILALAAAMFVFAVWQLHAPG